VRLKITSLSGLADPVSERIQLADRCEMTLAEFEIIQFATLEGVNL
jgi:hypothetical protein